MKNILIESRILDILAFFDASDAITKQREGITRMKKSKALGNFGIAIVLLVFGTILGALVSIYGTNVFGAKVFLIFLIGGLISLLGGMYMLFSSLDRAATASQFTFEADLEKLCRTFYSNVFCKKTTDFGSKDDQIVNVCQFIPVPILENYRKSGWSTFIRMSKPRSGSQPIECARCHKKSEHSEIFTTSIPVSTKFREEHRRKESVETKNLINDLYLKCRDCGTFFCYECVGYSSLKELRYLCSVCGNATSGWNGLAQRWMNVRYSKVKEDVDFSLTSVDVDRSPRSDPRIIDSPFDGSNLHLLGGKTLV